MGVDPQTHRLYRLAADGDLNAERALYRKLHRKHGFANKYEVPIVITSGSHRKVIDLLDRLNFRMVKAIGTNGTDVLFVNGNCETYIRLSFESKVIRCWQYWAWWKEKRRTDPNFKSAYRYQPYNNGAVKQAALIELPSCAISIHDDRFSVVLDGFKLTREEL